MRLSVALSAFAALALAAVPASAAEYPAEIGAESPELFSGETLGAEVVETDTLEAVARDPDRLSNFVDVVENPPHFSATASGAAVSIEPAPARKVEVGWRLR